MAQNLQQQFEESARIIMNRLNKKLENIYYSTFRIEAIKEAKEEMMELKSMYQGLIEIPIEDARFAEIMQLKQ